MDDEKKKKRNKKKKNKQQKRADGDAIPTTGVATSDDGNHNGDADIAQSNQVPDSIELQPSSQHIINVSCQISSSTDPRNID